MDLDIIDMEIDPNRKRKRNVKVGLGITIFIGSVGLVFKLLHWPGGNVLIISSQAMMISWFIIKQIYYRNERGVMGRLTFTALMIGFAGSMLIGNWFFVVSEIIQFAIPMFFIAYLFGRPRVTKQ